MSDSTPERGSSEAGFTLMEVLAALTIFLVGVVGVIALLSAGTQMHSSSQRLAEASDLLEEVILMAENDLLVAGRDPESGLPIGPSETLIVPGHEGMLYRWEVRAGEAAPPYLLEVEVFWQEGGQVRSLKSHRAMAGLRPQAGEIRLLRNESRR